MKFTVGHGAGDGQEKALLGLLVGEQFVAHAMMRATKGIGGHLAMIVGALAVDYP
jgi:hypothetical protein